MGEKIYAEEVGLVDTNLVNYLRKSYVPLARAGNYNWKRDYISLDYQTAKVGNGKEIKTYGVTVTVGGIQCVLADNACWARELNKEYYITVIDGVYFQIQDPEDHSWFKKTGKMRYVGTLPQILLLNNDNSFALTFYADDGIFRFVHISDWGCSWLETPGVKEYLPHKQFKIPKSALPQIPDLKLRIAPLQARKIEKISIPETSNKISKNRTRNR